MRTTALEGGFANPPIEAARAFRAALQAMARPGRIQRITGAEPPAPLSVAAGTLALTLFDADTPVFLAASHDLPSVRDWITFHTGAPFASREQAAFAIGTWDALLPLDSFPVGTTEYPDRSASLIIERESLDSKGARLSGPGIETTILLALPELAAFQRNAALFPLGLDFFFTARERVAALPRTTKVEAP